MHLPAQDDDVISDADRTFMASTTPADALVSQNATDRQKAERVLRALRRADARVARMRSHAEDVLMQAQSDRIGGQSLEIIPVARNRASDLVDLVEDLYVETENRRRGEAVVRVNADAHVDVIELHGDLPDQFIAIQPGADRHDPLHPRKPRAANSPFGGDFHFAVIKVTMAVYEHKAASSKNRRIRSRT